MAPRLSLSFKLGEIGAERGPATLVNHPLLVGSGKRKERRQSGGRKEKGARRRGRIGQQVAARRRPDSSAAARWSVRRRRAHPVRSPFPREERAAARPAPGRRGDFPRPSLGSAKARSRRAYEGKGTGPPCCCARVRVSLDAVERAPLPYRECQSALTQQSAAAFRRGGGARACMGSGLARRATIPPLAARTQAAHRTRRSALRARLSLGPLGLLGSYVSGLG